ncbi:MAG: DUF2950 domain-containing protein [Phycisphaerales bacterium]|nr:DUF2950 domain-containing protein [Phycisphaerales bacterium]
MLRVLNKTIGCRRINGLVSGALAMGFGVMLACQLGGCASGPRPYATPDAAVDSLVTAMRGGNQSELNKILGPDSRELLSSGDEVADASGRAEFLRLYDTKHRLIPDGDDFMTLEVGADEWPLPVPLVKGGDGWTFDTAAGLDEMLSRRIGRNELYAIQVCAAIVDAQREYASADFTGDGWREYARRFNSEPGKRNGLYWPAAPGEPESPLGELVASATSEGYTGSKQASSGPRPFHGYLYRILTAQGPAAPGGALDFVAQGHMIGGFGVVAWPADYANSGLKTFIVSHHGTVYEKDLGDDTDRIARAMKTFNPEPGWTVSDTSITP